jgi:hypothetical protein
MTSPHSITRPTAEAMTAIPAVEVTEVMRDRNAWFAPMGEAPRGGFSGGVGALDQSNGDGGVSGAGRAGAGEATNVSTTLTCVGIEMDSRVNPRADPAAAAPELARFVSEVDTAAIVSVVRASISTSTTTDPAVTLAMVTSAGCTLTTRAKANLNALALKSATVPAMLYV